MGVDSDRRRLRFSSEILAASLQGRTKHMPKGREADPPLNVREQQEVLKYELLHITVVMERWDAARRSLIVQAYEAGISAYEIGKISHMSTGRVQRIVAKGSPQDEAAVDEAVDYALEHDAETLKRLMDS